MVSPWPFSIWGMDILITFPIAIGQAEVANKVILRELNKWLDEAKKRWVEQLVEVLWAYRYTP